MTNERIRELLEAWESKEREIKEYMAKLAPNADVPPELGAEMAAERREQGERMIEQLREIYRAFVEACADSSNHP